MKNKEKSKSHQRSYKDILDTISVEGASSDEDLDALSTADPLLDKDTFERDGDDSSDEDTISKAYANYNFQYKYEEYLAKRPDYLKKYDKEGYSFIAFAKGLELLYSPEVNACYYKLKNKLGEHKLNVSEETILDWITTSIQDALRTVADSEANQAVVEVIFKDQKKYLQEFALRLSKHKRYLFRQKYDSKMLSELSEYFQELIAYIIDCVNEFPDDHFEVGKKYFTAESLAKNKLIQTMVSQEIKAYLDKNTLINTKNKLLKQPDRRNKIAIIRDDANKFFQFVLDDLNDIRSMDIDNILSKKTVAFCVQKIIGIIEKELNQIKPVIAVGEEDNYYFTQTVRIDKSKFAPLWQANKKLLQALLPKNLKTLKSEFCKHLSAAFFENFPKKLSENQSKYGIQIERPTLPPQYTFKSETAIEFLANLRLAYRDQIRQIRQARDEQGEKMDGEKFQRAWEMKINIPALEDEEITTCGAKRDLVINLKKYEGVYHRLLKLKESINTHLKKTDQELIQDEDLARWIMEIMRHAQEKIPIFTFASGVPIKLDNAKLKQLTKLLVNITFLIFGCEVIRNPASLVTHPLMLNRIENEELSWKKALNKEIKAAKGTDAKHSRHIKYGGGEMPMSMGGYVEKGKKKQAEPVAAARALQKHYGKFAIREYCYPGDELKEHNSKDREKIQELVHREHDMIKNTLDLQKSGKSIEEKIESIEEKVVEFYGVSNRK